jgi:hypothetical protein
MKQGEKIKRAFSNSGEDNAQNKFTVRTSSGIWVMLPLSLLWL